MHVRATRRRGDHIKNIWEQETPRHIYKSLHRLRDISSSRSNRPPLRTRTFVCQTVANMFLIYLFGILGFLGLGRSHDRLGILHSLPLETLLRKFVQQLLVQLCRDRLVLVLHLQIGMLREQVEDHPPLHGGLDPRPVGVGVPLLSLFLHLLLEVVHLLVHVDGIGHDLLRLRDDFDGHGHREVLLDALFVDLLEFEKVLRGDEFLDLGVGSAVVAHLGHGHGVFFAGLLGEYRVGTFHVDAGGEGVGEGGVAGVRVFRGLVVVDGLGELGGEVGEGHAGTDLPGESIVEGGEGAGVGLEDFDVEDGTFSGQGLVFESLGKVNAHGPLLSDLGSDQSLDQSLHVSSFAQDDLHIISAGGRRQRLRFGHSVLRGHVSHHIHHGGVSHRQSRRSLVHGR
mmetsp:Transcript_35278/g.81705  ORF Transcript_35278/g.81705 Transcript_35278/m.81705 type:complete len:397 (+) Transcript_35278:154-1344(+)